ncbi:MAG: cytochrome c3 family protein [Desulfocapsaceae bacterium]|jgi:hypothetical protein|nr:cytochrome c3 family protein [Desulfocapsaceae bacterium]
MKTGFIVSLSTVFCILLMQNTSWAEAQSSPAPPPAVVTMGQISNLYGPVDFDHQLHSDYAACSECHHHTTGSPPSRPSCTPCHTGAEKTDSAACSSCHHHLPEHRENPASSASGLPYHIDIPSLKGAYHLLCIDCHEAITSGPTQCEDCHTLTPEGRLFYRIDKEDGSETPLRKKSGETTK